MGQQSANILDCDLLIAPANIRRSHWTCAVADLRNKRFIYHSSFGIITIHPRPPSPLLPRNVLPEWLPLDILAAVAGTI
jgi:hypothetical protein